MRRSAGHQCLNVRVNFNSFILAIVPEDLAERLVQDYLDRRDSHPQYPDKVVFDLVLTYLPFDYERGIEPLLDAGFTRRELEPLHDGLEAMTPRRPNVSRPTRPRSITSNPGTNKSKTPTSHPSPRLTTFWRTAGDSERFYLLTSPEPPFVATLLLRSLEGIKVLTDEQVSEFQKVLYTVARRFELDGLDAEATNLDGKIVIIPQVDLHSSHFRLW